MEGCPHPRHGCVFINRWACRGRYPDVGRPEAISKNLCRRWQSLCGDAQPCAASGDARANSRPADRNGSDLLRRWHDAVGHAKPTNSDGETMNNESQPVLTHERNLLTFWEEAM